MNLPKIEPIVWENAKPAKPQMEFLEPPQKIQIIPPPNLDDVRHDYVGTDSIIYTHYPI